MAARLFSTRLRGNVVSWQRLRIVLLGGFVSVVAGFTASSAARAQLLSKQPNSLVDLSPLVAKSTLLSAMDGAKEISVVLVLPLKHAEEAAEFAERVSTPMDPLYGKFLTPEQFAAAYGADEGDYAAVKAWAVANHLKISDESVSRTTLAVRGTVSQFETLFNTHLNHYRSPKGDEFYSAESKPMVPAAIASRLKGVIGLTNSKQYASHVRVQQKFGETPAAKAITDTGGTGPGAAFSPGDIRSLYNIDDVVGYAVKQTVALFEQGGYAVSDITRYRKEFSVPDVPVKPRLVNGFGGGIDDPNVELEAVLDIDMCIGLNSLLREVLVYEDGDDPFGVALLDAISDVASDDKAQVLSISYGLDEFLQGNAQMAAEGQVFVQLAAQGITVFVSAGDGGAYGDEGFGLNVADPASQPDVTGVGGTSMVTHPNAKGQPLYIAEQVWNDLWLGAGATGGGVSSYWSIPDYQAPGVVSGNGGSSTNRNVPDVAAVADPLTGVAIYSALNGGWNEVGGTSVASPIWAAYLSLLNSARLTLGLDKVGFFNPSLYNWPSFGYLYPAWDVTYGNNSDPADNDGIVGYSAGTQYDNCTGWGSIFGYTAETTDFVLFQPTKSEKLPDAPTGITTQVHGRNVTISWKAASGALGYYIFFPVNGSPGFYISKATSIELTSLSPHVIYTAQVTAINKSGSSASITFYLPPVQ
jgi:subtilase family serine protease